MHPAIIVKMKSKSLAALLGTSVPLKNKPGDVHSITYFAKPLFLFTSQHKSAMGRISSCLLADRGVQRAAEQGYCG